MYSNSSPSKTMRPMHTTQANTNLNHLGLFMIRK